jgi:phage/plasmid-associated DNA primase
MFQFPSSRSLLLVLQGDEGCGKSIFMDFIAAIMGPCLALEIADVKETLFTRFNAILGGKIFLNINETSRGEMMPFIEKLKTIITSPTITLEEKGQKRYTDQNLAHLVMTVNPENVIPIKKGSRRFFYSRASNNHTGDIEYFNELGDLMGRSRTQRAFYQFLMSRPVKKNITIKDIPETETMEELYELNKDPVEDYLAEFKEDLTSQENYNAYKRFLQDNGLKFEISKKAFEAKVGKYRKEYGVEVKQLMKDGVRYRLFTKVPPKVEAGTPPLTLEGV